MVRAALAPGGVLAQARVVLLTGPESVGKWAVAEEAARAGSQHPADIARHRKLDAEGVRKMLRASSYLQECGVRYILAGLDTASDQVQNMLLKFLEAPPDGVRVLLTASGGVLPTIFSRAQHRRLGLLTDEQVFQVLVQLGMAEDAARRHAPLGGGRVRPAMEGPDPQARAQVVSVLRALEAGSLGQLEIALRGFTQEAYWLLLSWATESSSGRFRQATRDMAPWFGAFASRRILRALGGASPLASPGLTAHAALVPLCPEP